MAYVHGVEFGADTALVSEWIPLLDAATQRGGARGPAARAAT